MNRYRQKRFVIGRKKKRDVPLHVVMPDGTVIAEVQGVDTFVKVIEKLGIERVKALGIIAIQNRNLPLISDNKDREGTVQRRSGSYYIATGFGSETKKQFLDKIAAELEIQMTVTATPTAIKKSSQIV